MTRSTATSIRLRRASLVVSGLVTLGVAAWISFQLLPGAEPTSTKEASRPEANAPEVTNVSVTAPDPATSLLGTASSISPDELTLVLVATSPGRTPREGTATLGTDPRNPQTYAAGASLVNGAVIEEIHADHVVLALDGKHSVLAIGGKTIGRRLAQVLASSDSAATRVGGAGVIAQPLETVASSREDLSEIIRPEPIYELDRVTGIKLLPGRDRPRFEALGLQSGDIVRTIDGKPLRSVDAAWQTIDDALSTSTKIVMSIERDGNLTSVFLDGSKLAQEPIQMSAAAPPLAPGS